MYDEDDLLPLSALQHLVYCERRAALVHIEGLWAENVATVQGTRLHQSVDELGRRGETRGEVHAARGVALHSLSLGLIGKADIIEFRQVGSRDQGVELPGLKGRWLPKPIEYKRGVRRRESAYLVQLCAQAICLEEMLGTKVEHGALYFGTTRRRLDVQFDETLRGQTAAAAARLHELLVSGRTPPPVPGPRCLHCSMHPLCLPTTKAAGRSARDYLEAILACRSG